MNLKEYQEQALRTCPDLGSLEKNILHMEMGILTEIGEIVDIFKKNIAYNKPIDYINLGEEIADVCWYAVNLDRLKKVIYLDEDKPLYYSMGPLEEQDIFYSLLNYQQDISNVLNLMFNIAESFSEQDVDFYKCLENNINKLKIRYKDKFTQSEALNRNLIEERKELEK